MKGLGPRLALLAEPLSNRSTRWALLAFAVSELGDGIAAVVIPLAVFEFSDSMTLLAGSFVGRLSLGVVLGAIGGYVADRWDRRLVVTGTYVLRACLVLVLVGVGESGIVLFALVGILLGAFASFDNPSAEAFLRDRMRHNLQAIAAARKVARTLSALAGPAVGAVLMGVGGITVALVADGVSFLLAVALIAVGWREPPRDPAAEGARRFEVDALPSHEGRTLFSLVTSSETMTLSFVSAFFAGMAVAVAVVVAIPYLDSLDGSPRGAYGWALAVYALGSIGGISLAGLLKWRVPLRTLLIRANIVYGVCCAIGVVSGQWWVLALSWFLWGVSYGPEEVVADARVAGTTPSGALGRVYAAWSIVARVAAIGGYLTAGGLGTFVDPAALIMGTGVAYAIVAPAVLSIVAARYRRWPSTA